MTAVLHGNDDSLGFMVATLIIAMFLFLGGRLSTGDDGRGF
jgi:hypothetical protein